MHMDVDTSQTEESLNENSREQPTLVIDLKDGSEKIQAQDWLGTGL